MKDSVKFVPFLGWFTALSDNILLKRNFQHDKILIEKKLKELLKNPNKIWITLASEGTVFSREKHAKAIKFCLDKNLPILEHHLVPKPSGFITAIEYLKKTGFKSVLNCELVYSSQFASPTILNLIQGKKMSAHLYLEFIPIENVEPTFEWLFKFYQRKDELFESFLSTGKFCDELGVIKMKMEKQKKHLINFVCCGIFWIAFTVYICLKIEFGIRDMIFGVLILYLPGKDN